jgi:drug/metabolite transporter (DMT)-like permease
MINSNSATQSTGRGYAIALTSAAILSTTAIFIRYLTETYAIPALVLAFWRDVFVALTLVIFLGLFRPGLLWVGRHHLLYLVAYGLALSLFNASLTQSVTLNGAAIATVLVYSSAGFTVLLGRWLLKERLDWARFLTALFSLSGCVLVSGAFDPAAWHANLLGILSGVFSGLGYAAYTLMGRSAAQRGLNPWTTILYTFGFAAAFLLGYNLLPGDSIPASAARLQDMFWLGEQLAGWGILFLLAAGPTVAGFGLYNISLGYLPSGVVNLIVMTETVFTAVIAYLLLGEQLSRVQVLGSLVILSGVVLLRLIENRDTNQIEKKARIALLEDRGLDCG